MEIAGDEVRGMLAQEGVVLLRNGVAREPLLRLRAAAERCFEAIGRMERIPGEYCFIPQAHSLRARALLDFGVGSEEELGGPLRADGVGALFADVGEGWRCRLEHSWVRKKFAPGKAASTGYRIQDWHQDGALGVQFPIEPGAAIPATPMAICWVPLDACGRDSPGLEFIRRGQAGLLHFTELDDGLLRRRFEAEAFWAPELELGDVVLFRGDVLHRTHVTPEMRADRMSIEYRIFSEKT
jgi:hypothetical protein